MRILKRRGTLALNCSTAPTELHTHCDRVQQILLTTHIITHVQQLSLTTHHHTCSATSLTTHRHTCPATFTDHTHCETCSTTYAVHTLCDTHSTTFSNHLAHNACMQHSHTLFFFLTEKKNTHNYSHTSQN